MKIRALGLLMAALLLFGCGGQTDVPAVSAPPGEPVAQSTPHESNSALPEGFILGMDASSVIAEEQSGVKYYGFSGEEQDVFLTLSECGITHIRVRVWNDPYDADGNGYGGGNCDVQKAVEIGRRAAKVGLQLIVDFHYSDFWADPGKQQAPKAWQGMELAEKTDALFIFTRDALNELKTAGAAVGMVQLGNETNSGLCGETEWENVTALMKSGARAVREVFHDALIAVHFTNPEQAGLFAFYAETLQNFGVDYDVFATSYYPFWHGTLENLQRVLGDVARAYGKQVMVLETSYPYTPDDTDFSGNTINGDTANIAAPYPFTVQGQADSVRAVIETVANTENGVGVVYWEGTWISVGTDSWEANHQKWETYGSGWASSFAKDYDPTDAGSYYGGCAVDNQAMFDATGHPLDSLLIWKIVREGK